MATLALAAGGALLPAGISVLGATITGATIGSQAGALAGSFIDQALFAPSGQTRVYEGPRLRELRVTASTEGAPIPRLYGRARLGGQIIWATDFEEEITTTTEAGGSGKGAPRRSASTTRTTQYRYYANFAVALAEGRVSGIGRVWADGAELDLAGVTTRLYLGTEDQEPDALIVSREGAENAPAYRGTAYIVFERLPLADYGNRLPQLSFEVFRAVDGFDQLVRAVVVIPGSGEFVYGTEPVTRLGDGGLRLYENVHTSQGGTDWSVAIDQLEQALPNARNVSLVVSWFGTDLRAGECRIRPGVEIASKDTHPHAWSVAGLARGDAHLVSMHDGRPAYGGTPSDADVIAAIADLRARGIGVTLTPFVLMDVPAGNALADPWSGAASQPAYPWRGRITCDPAPGQSGSPDQTAAAETQLASFVGSAAVSDFAIFDGAVVYSGPDEWSLRRQVLHYAHLAQAAGGVDAFIIASELRSLGHVRSAAASYPFVDALIALAADVKAILGPATRITYAADWSEYFGHQPQDGSGDVHFHLDPLWASAAIDAIGIDLYWPLADWRHEPDHADALAGARSAYDLDYLRANIAGGEGYDWHYASAADRDAQVRTPITDGAGKPWVFRYKDLASWWSNPHYDRPGGTESVTPTAWVAGSKPIWITEVGCPAVDNGANQPNVFVDPKSAETALPYFSDGRRDDLAQRRYLDAIIGALDPRSPAAIAALNPVSPLYGGPMIDPDHIHVYAWDARPYPAFPYDTETWGDGANWRLGHWLNGRVASAPVANVVARMLTDYGFDAFDASELPGVVPGYAVDRIMSAREAIQPLEMACFFDAIESGGAIAFRPRGASGPVAVLTEDHLAETRGGSLLTLIRTEESDLPLSAKIAYIAAAQDYRPAVAEARRLSGSAGRISQAELPMVLEADEAAAIAETFLFEAWAARETATFVCPPSRMALEPGDVVAVIVAGRERAFRIREIGDHGEREIVALSIDPGLYAKPLASDRAPALPSPPVAGQPLLELLDLPLLRGDEPEHSGFAAAVQKPWPGAIAIYASPESDGYELRAEIAAPAILGATLEPVPSGPVGRIDRAARLLVKLDGGELAGVTHLKMLAGRNLAALRVGDDTWEVLQFEHAELIAPQTYALTRLLRGQAGTDADMTEIVPPGARFVLLDGAVTRIDLAAAETGLALNWRYGPAARDLGSEAYAERQHAFRGLGRRPMSPVHIRGQRTSDGLTIGWIRRTRTGGDNWDVLDAPLGEESERYEVDVLDGSTVVRTLTSATPSVDYTTAEQIADFGSVPSVVAVRVCQIGAVWGRGATRTAII